MPTIETVEEAWKRFDEIKDTAEQYMFPALLMWDLKLTPLYKDLHKNWDTRHAEVFLKGMDVMFKSFGCQTMGEWRAENAAQ